MDQTPTRSVQVEVVCVNKTTILVIMVTAYSVQVSSPDPILFICQIYVGKLTKRGNDNK